jgi:hypothetical protein
VSQLIFNIIFSHSIEKKLCSFEELSDHDCQNIKPTSELSIKVFKGSIICGKRGKLDFYDIRTPHNTRWLQEVEGKLNTYAHINV